jgi:hypothetical protein
MQLVILAARIALRRQSPLPTVSREWRHPAIGFRTQNQQMEHRDQLFVGSTIFADHARQNRIAEKNKVLEPNWQESFGIGGPRFVHVAVFSLLCDYDAVRELSSFPEWSKTYNSSSVVL